MSNAAHTPDGEAVVNENRHTHPEMTESAERAERQSSAIDVKGRRMDPAWAFLLIAGTMIVISAFVMTVLGMLHML